jgi:malate dehydrogenase
MPKISVIGAGNVGATAALKIAQKGLGDVVLVDVVEGVPQGKALDIEQSMPLWGSTSRITGTNDFSDMADSDVVVVTAGVPRKPGMSREDLLEVNSGIMKSVCREIRQHAPGSVVIVVTNPLDSMAYLAYRELGFPRERVMGMAGVLDTARFRCFLAQELGTDPSQIEALVLGSHGDSMVPVIEHARAGGKGVRNLLSPERLNAVVERTRNAGAEIVSHLKTGSAFYAPGASIAEMAEAVLKDTGKILPVSAYLEGEYGHSGIFLGVPARLGGNGIEEIVEVEMEQETREALGRSARVIKEALGRLNLPE